MSQYRVYVCHNDSCKSRGAREVWRALRRELERQGDDVDTDLIVATCQGRCDWGPNLTIHPGATKYSGVTPDDAEAIVREHLSGGQPVERLIFSEW